ncbi:MAG: LysM peptidoglycan-binding domain-containing protein [Myxococcales bacterium]|nr:MAG: LysM peptidoglycan-binding domain-containing protein [Myxococcales bacterium]
MRFLARIALGCALLLSSGVALGKDHVVADGQTWGKIAKRYQISIEALCKANNMTRRDKIKPGMRLTIPTGNDDAATTTASLRDLGEAEAPPEARPPAAPPVAIKDEPRKDKDREDPDDRSVGGGLRQIDLPGAAPAYYFEPVGKGRLGLKPVLVYLHGRGGHPEADCRRWAGLARRYGWLVCPSGPVPYGDGRAWDNNWPSAHHATMAAINALREKYGRRVQLWGNTLIGFSEGAYAAMNVGVREPRTFNRWLILAANSKYWGGPGLEALGSAKDRVRRVFLITGEHDGVIEGTHQVEAWLQKAGVPTRVITPSNMGHETPLEKKTEMYRAALTWLDGG